MRFQTSSDQKLFVEITHLYCQLSIGVRNQFHVAAKDSRNSDFSTLNICSLIESLVIDASQNLQVDINIRSQCNLHLSANQVYR